MVNKALYIALAVSALTWALMASYDCHPLECPYPIFDFCIYGVFAAMMVAVVFGTDRMIKLINDNF